MHNLTPAEISYQYTAGQIRKNLPSLLDEYTAASRIAVEKLRPQIDVRYGPHPREVYDYFRPKGVSRALLIFFHAGYWQSRDKSFFRFLASDYCENGFAFAAVNYPLCPEVTIEDILSSTKRAITTITEHHRAEFNSSSPLLLSGHSAGGHLVSEFALRQRSWMIEHGPTALISLSGLYDLLPLVDTPVNDKLGLDHFAAKILSPLFHVGKAVPGIFGVGADETTVFQDQTQMMADAWQEAGNATRRAIVPECDHFTLLKVFGFQDGQLFRQVMEVANEIQRTI